MSILRRALGRLPMGERGAVALESALVFAPLLLLTCAMFEVPILYIAQLSVQSASAEAAAEGRAAIDPESVPANWGSKRHPFLFADMMTVSVACYADAAGFLAGSPAPTCAGAKVVAYGAAMDWPTMTPMFRWFLGPSRHLEAMGVAVR